MTQAVEPGSLKEPAGQAAHSVDPASLAKVSAGQSSQRSVFAFVPAGQTLHSLEPIAATLPGAQASQLERRSFGICPAGQGRQVAARGMLTQPAGHASQTLRPIGANVPASHGVHAAMPFSLVMVPGTHGVQLAAPGGANVPAEQGVHVDASGFGAIDPPGQSLQPPPSAY